MVKFEWSIALGFSFSSTLLFAALLKFEAVRSDFRFSSHKGFLFLPLVILAVSLISSLVAVKFATSSSTILLNPYVAMS